MVDPAKDNQQYVQNLVERQIDFPFVRFGCNSLHINNNVEILPQFTTRKYHIDSLLGLRPITVSGFGNRTISLLPQYLHSSTS